MDPRSAAFTGQRVGWLLGCLLVLGCVAIYREVGSFDFVTFDDEHCIVFNPHMGPATFERASWAFTDVSYARRYMPLGWLGFAAVFSWFGLEPSAYHWVGAILHATNAVLLFLVIFRICDLRLGLGDRIGRDWRPIAVFLGAAFWAWHPLRVESVAWSAGLLYGQAMFFLLLAVAAMLAPFGGRLARLFSNFCYGASLLTYPLAIGFVPVFALIAAWRNAGWREAGRVTMPYALASGIVLAINLHLRVDAGEAFRQAPTWAEFPLLNRVTQACYLWVYYLWKPFWPTDLTLLNPALIDFDPWSVRFVGSAVGMFLIGGIALIWRPFRTTLGVFLLVHMAVLVPMLGLAEIPHFPSDRYAGFSQIVLATVLGLALARIARAQSRGWVALAGLGVCFGLGSVSADQTLVWRDAQTLFRHVGRFLRPEQSPLMLFERPAVLLYRSGDLSGALALYDRGIAELPEEPALVVGREALLRQATEHRERLAAIGAPASTPPVVFLQQSLGLAAARAGDAQTALAHLQRARRSAPDFYETAYNLALVWLQLGETREALGNFFWAEIHGGDRLSVAAKTRLLNLIAEQFDAAGEVRLAEAARKRAASGATALPSVQ
jgi:hypothetical protein